MIDAATAKANEKTDEKVADPFEDEVEPSNLGASNSITSGNTVEA